MPKAAAADPDTGTPATEPVPDDVRAVLELIGANVSKITVSRLGVGGRGAAYITTLLTDEFDLDELKRQYGGGRFQAKFHATDGKVIQAANFEIDGPPRSPPPEPEASTGPFDGSTLRELFDLAAPIAIPLILKRLLDPPARQGTDPLELAAKLADSMRASSDQAVSRALEVVAKAGNGGGDALALFMKGLKLGKELRPETEDPLARLGERALDLLQQTQSQTPRALPAAGTPPAPAPAPATNGGPNVATPNLPRALSALALYVPTLVKWAREDRDPKIYAGVLLDEIPEAAAPHLAAALVDPDLVETVRAAVPELHPYGAWLTDFVEGLRYELEDPAGSGGDAGDAGPDAPAGAGVPLG